MAPRDTWKQVLAEVQPAGTYLSAMVEIAGGGGFVEQQANTDVGQRGQPVLEQHVRAVVLRRQLHAERQQ